ncbi:hypothetical protein ILUMI_23960 [Ignelater luminosus]|uniref:Uncharacterized protein n=1 Tax=Ignelater luminosus TaxID=2038154 RepID=A0A8K0C7W6_IGNLU|nr:hypothetical protein ILUMI_23960 [Ignelater luminosus]
MRVLDTKVLRGPGSDHHLVRMTFMVPICRKTKGRIKVNTRIKKHKRRRIKKRIPKVATRKVREATGEFSRNDSERMWGTFKNIIMEAAETALGKSRVGIKVERIRWWREQFKQVVANKKRAWKMYLENRRDEHRQATKQNRNAKRERSKIKDEEGKQRGIALGKPKTFL